jgi:hypothetical protein
LPGIEEQIEQRLIGCERCGATLELVRGRPYCPGCPRFVKFKPDGTQK